MKLLRVKNSFFDKEANNIKRKIDEEFKASDDRAKDLVSRGFAVLLENIVEKEIVVEEAVKEVKKEKAVKEKKIAKK